MFRSRRRPDNFINEAIEQAHEANRSVSVGGKFATIISAIALAFSGYSFYETALKSPDLSIYIPPRIAYTDPDRPSSPLEVFVLPLTLANDGARTGTILSIDLKVSNPRTGESKQFYAARLGSWGAAPRQPFMPVALAGKSSWSQAVQFIPRAGEKVPRILDIKPNQYHFELNLHTAKTAGSLPMLETSVKPLRFSMQAGQMNYIFFNKTGTMPLWSNDFLPQQSGK